MKVSDTYKSTSLFGKVKFGNKRSCIACCQPIRKYSLEENKWEEATRNNAGKAFSVVKYSTEFGKQANNTNSDFEYFILLDGMRPENYSKTGTSFDGNNGWGIKNYLNDLENKNSRIKALTILVDKDAPLEEQSRLLAHKVNKLKNMEHCKGINILGISKCGTMTVSMLKYLQNSNLDKLHVVSAEAPYLGTIYASPNLLYAKADETLKKIPENMIKRFIPFLQQIRPRTKQTQSLNDKLSPAKILTNLHWNVFSQSHMDYDISSLGEDGVPNQHLDRYDENYLKDLFNEQTLAKLRQVDFTNVTTYCTKKTLENSIKSLNATGVLLYVSNNVLFDETSDGMVSLRSCRYIEEVCKQHNIPISALKLNDGHHAISSDKTMVKKIMEHMYNKKDKKIEDAWTR